MAEAQRVIQRNEALVSSGTTVVGRNGASFSGTLGLSAFVVVGNFDNSFELGVQHLFCITRTDTVNTAICQGDTAALMAVLPAGVTLGSDVNPQEAGFYETEYKILTYDGCDSIIHYAITVLPKTDTTIMVQRDEPYTWNGMVIDSSGIYSDVKAASNGCDSIINLQLMIVGKGIIPEIYHHQRRVIMVNHNASGHNVRWETYRWYRNGVLVGEGKDSYMDGGMALGGCFQLEVPTDSTLTQWVRSEELCLDNLPMPTDDITVTVEPNPARRSGVITFYINASPERLYDGRVVIYDVRGRTMAETMASHQVRLTANFATGIYTAHIMLTDGTHICRKILVR